MTKVKLPAPEMLAITADYTFTAEEAPMKKGKKGPKSKGKVGKKMPFAAAVKAAKSKGKC